MSGQYPVYVANDAAHLALLENCTNLYRSKCEAITSDVPSNYPTGHQGIFTATTVSSLNLPTTYAHIITSKNQAEIAQIAIDATAASKVYVRTGTNSDGWRTPTYSNSNGWVRLAVTDTNGYVHSAVYN